MDIAAFDLACARLPGALRVIQWGGSHVWKIGPRMFAVAGSATGGNGTGPFACSVKSSELARQALAHEPGVTPAPCLARAGWLRIETGAMSDDGIADMIRVSHQLVLDQMPANLRATLVGARS